MASSELCVAFPQRTTAPRLDRTTWCARGVCLCYCAPICALACHTRPVCQAVTVRGCHELPQVLRHCERYQRWLRTSGKTLPPWLVQSIALALLHTRSQVAPWHEEVPAVGSPKGWLRGQRIIRRVACWATSRMDSPGQAQCSQHAQVEPRSQ